VSELAGQRLDVGIAAEHLELGRQVERDLLAGPGREHPHQVEP
jgi:hypothetical protein